MISFVFDERKATDAAAFLLSLNENKLPYLKLLKLLYTADRTSLSEYHYSITTDSYYSMKYGPVVSGIYDCISHREDLPDGSPWKNTITVNKQTYTAEFKKNDCDFNMLSEEEEDILRRVNGENTEDGQFELSEYTHSFAEWKDPGQSRIPLPIEDIIDATIKDEAEKEEALSELELSSQLQRITFRNRGIYG